MKLNRFIKILLICTVFIFIGLIKAYAQESTETGTEWYTIEKALYKMLPEDTLESIAVRFLGGKEYLSELIEFNRIKDPSSVGPGFILVLPGPVRDEAINRISVAKRELQKAMDAVAETYAPQELDLALSSIDAATDSRKLGVYDKATALGELARIRSIHAKKMADERAVIKQSGKITAIKGNVQISTDGRKNWNSAVLNQNFPVSAILRTAEESRAELTMADTSVIQVQESTEFTALEYHYDRRNGKRNSKLEVTIGNILGKIAKSKTKDSTFNIKSRSTILAIRGTDLRVGTDEEETFRLSVLEGHVTAQARKKKIDVLGNYGTYVPKNRPPKKPIELIPPPQMISHRDTLLETALQIINFKWGKNEETPKTKLGFFSRKILGKKLITYHLEIASDKLFNQIVQNHFTAKNKLESDTLAPGTYYWRISSLDKNKLEGPSSEIKELVIIRNLELNMIPQTEPIHSLNQWIIGPTNVIEVDKKFEDSSVSRIEFSLNNGEYFATDGRIFFHSEGEFLLMVRGVGADGFRGEPIVQDIYVDTTPPKIDYKISSTQRDAIIGEFVYVTLDVTDQSGVESIVYNINQGKLKSYTGRFKLKVETKYKNVHVQAVDILGKDVIDKHFKIPIFIDIGVHAADVVGNHSSIDIPLEF